MIKIREVKDEKGRERYEVDIRFNWEDSTPHRKRCLAPLPVRAGVVPQWSKRGESDATRWANDEYARLLREGKAAVVPQPKKAEAPTLQVFFPRFIAEYCEVERQKPSGIAAKQSVFKNHILPLLGPKRLDEIGTADIQALKGKLAKKSPKTANNVLTALGACLRFAGPEGLGQQDGLGIIQHVPRIRLFKVPQKKLEENVDWYELEKYERLVAGAEKYDARAHLVVLLAGDAGLRRGEIIALKWTDLDMKNGRITVARSVWSETNEKRYETLPKGNEPVTLRMTSRLATALAKHRHLKGPRVLYADNGKEPTNKHICKWMKASKRRAGLEENGRIHVLRHTFCSNLAAAGVAPIVLQGLARHKDLATTARYTHAGEAILDNGIEALQRWSGNGAAAF